MRAVENQEPIKGTCMTADYSMRSSILDAQAPLMNFVVVTASRSISSASVILVSVPVPLIIVSAPVASVILVRAPVLIPVFSFEPDLFGVAVPGQFGPRPTP